MVSREIRRGRDSEKQKKKSREREKGSAWKWERGGKIMVLQIFRPCCSSTWHSKPRCSFSIDWSEDEIRENQSESIPQVLKHKQTLVVFNSIFLFFPLPSLSLSLLLHLILTYCVANHRKRICPKVNNYDRTVVL